MALYSSRVRPLFSKRSLNEIGGITAGADPTGAAPGTILGGILGAVPGVIFYDRVLITLLLSPLLPLSLFCSPVLL